MAETERQDMPMLLEAVQSVSRAESMEQIEELLRRYPLLSGPRILEDIDGLVGEMQRSRASGWWPLTLAKMLLEGYRRGKFSEALFETRVRDLLIIGPEDIRSRVQHYPELLSEEGDLLLLRWASEEETAGERTRVKQIEMRRELLRTSAAEKNQALVDASRREEERFRLTGDLAALNRALAVRTELRHGVDAPFVSSYVRLAQTQAVSRILQNRFRATGALQDLDLAISECRRAIALLAKGSPSWQAVQAELASAYNCRYRELHDPSDIERAIDIFELLVAVPNAIAPTVEEEMTVPSNLATALLDRYYLMKVGADLERAIRLMREVVAASPAKSPRRELRQSNLAAALYLTFRDTGSKEALREAIDLQRELAETDDASLRAHRLTALARSLDEAVTIEEATGKEAAAAFRDAIRVGLETAPVDAIWAGMTWGRSAWSRGNLEEAAEAYGNCATVARRLFAEQASEASREMRLSQFREVAPRAAYALAHVGRNDDAALVFELSRAQLLDEALERGQGVRNAEELNGELPSSLTDPAVRRGCSVTLDDVKAASRMSPIVYLIYTDRGGLALLVLRGNIRCCWLPELTDTSVAEQVRSLLGGLEADTTKARIAAVDKACSWLWDAAMGSVVDELQGAETAILVPGGWLGLLPLHAAWTSDCTQSETRRYAFDATAFAYAPSARMHRLARERLQELKKQDDIRQAKALVVANPSPVSAGALKFARDEADLVTHIFGRAACLSEGDATLHEVLTRLVGVDVLHIACHGFADLRMPLESGVILADDEVLSVARIRELSLSTRLTVLSACNTAVAGTNLPDEVVAMPTALLQAGGTGIIASLWAVGDRATAMLMTEFYRQFAVNRLAPANAMRAAQQWMRDTTNAEKVRHWSSCAGEWLPAEVARRLSESLEVTDEHAHSAPWWWGAFTHVGA